LTSVYQLGDLTGESNVWIAFVFESNGSVNYSEGAFVDNVVLRKCTSPGCATMVSSPEDPEGDRLRERPAQETLERE
jgi:hypothetical protein